MWPQGQTRGTFRSIAMALAQDRDLWYDFSSYEDVTTKECFIEDSLKRSIAIGLAKKKEDEENVETHKNTTTAIAKYPQDRELWHDFRRDVSLIPKVRASDLLSVMDKECFVGNYTGIGQTPLILLSKDSQAEENEENVETRKNKTTAIAKYPQDRELCHASRYYVSLFPKLRVSDFLSLLQGEMHKACRSIAMAFAQDRDLWYDFSSYEDVTTKECFIEDSLKRSIAIGLAKKKEDEENVETHKNTTTAIAKYPQDRELWHDFRRDVSLIPKVRASDLLSVMDKECFVGNYTGIGQTPLILLSKDSQAEENEENVETRKNKTTAIAKYPQDRELCHASRYYVSLFPKLRVSDFLSLLQGEMHKECFIGNYATMGQTRGIKRSIAMAFDDMCGPVVLSNDSQAEEDEENVETRKTTRTAIAKYPQDRELWHDLHKRCMVHGHQMRIVSSLKNATMK